MLPHYGRESLSNAGTNSGGRHRRRPRHKVQQKRNNVRMQHDLPGDGFSLPYAKKDLDLSSEYLNEFLDNSHANFLRRMRYFHGVGDVVFFKPPGTLLNPPAELISLLRCI